MHVYMIIIALLDSKTIIIKNWFLGLEKGTHFGWSFDDLSLRLLICEADNVLHHTKTTYISSRKHHFKHSFMQCCGFASRMRIRIRLVTLVRIRMRIQILIFFYTDPDQTFHPDADPSFQIKAQTLEKVLNWVIFHTLWLVICKLMRTRFWIQLITLMWIRIRIFIWCGSKLLKWCGSISIRMRIRIHNTAFMIYLLENHRYKQKPALFYCTDFTSSSSLLRHYHSNHFIMLHKTRTYWNAQPKKYCTSQYNP